mmetsp:Transcript_24737/g.61645  ORF Transcript_24737/g.61645 Transcript_24737/m.61645 type:complete len:233 (+) Transcript_24737:206-904(+)
MQLSAVPSGLPASKSHDAAACSAGAVIPLALSGVRSTSLPPADAFRPTPVTDAAAPGSKTARPDDDTFETVELDALTTMVPHAPSGVHAAVYCLDKTRTETLPERTGTGCRGGSAHVTRVELYVSTVHGLGRSAILAEMYSERLTSGAGDPLGGNPTPVMVSVAPKYAPRAAGVTAVTAKFNLNPAGTVSAPGAEVPVPSPTVRITSYAPGAPPSMVHVSDVEDTVNIEHGT